MQSYFQYIPFVFSLFKTLFLQKKHEYKIKSFNKTREKIDTMEHLMVKQEKKLREMSIEIEDMRKQIMISRLFNLILFIVVIFLVIFLR
jgi:hypothetical protein